MTNSITRRAAIAGLSALATAPALAQSARPEGTVTVAHGFTPGGNVDLTARLIAERHPGLALSLSSDVAPQIREFDRSSTTVANAYVKRVLGGELQR